MSQNQLRRLGIDELRLENEQDLRTQIEGLYHLFSALSDVLENLSKFTRRPPVSTGLDFYEEVARFETNLIEESLRATNGNQARSALLLNLKPTTLNNKIKLYDIDCRRTRRDGSSQFSGVVPLTLSAKPGHKSNGGRT